MFICSYVAILIYHFSLLMSGELGFPIAPASILIKSERAPLELVERKAPNFCPLSMMAAIPPSPKKGCFLSLGDI